MRILTSAALALALASCGAPLTVTAPHQCAPTHIQPASDVAVTLRGRVAGCPNLVAVGVPGHDGVLLYVPRSGLGATDEQINALPVVQRGL